jgi:hypothetical protein
VRFHQLNRVRTVARVLVGAPQGLGRRAISADEAP